MLRLAHTNYALCLTVLFIQVFDDIPKLLDICYIDPVTCLSLPLHVATSSSPSNDNATIFSSTTALFHTLSLHPLICSDLFYFDSLTLRLELCQPLFNQCIHATLIHQALHSVLTGMVTFLAFSQQSHRPTPRITQMPTSFLNLYPFIMTLSSLLSRLYLPLFSICSYKHLTRSRYAAPPMILAPST